MNDFKLNLEKYSKHVIENEEYFTELDIQLNDLTLLLKKCKKNTNDNRNLCMPYTYTDNTNPENLLFELLLLKPENISFQHFCNFVSLHYGLSILFKTNEVEDTLNCFHPDCRKVEHSGYNKNGLEFGFPFHRHYVKDGNKNSSKMKFVHELITDPTLHDAYLNRENIKTIISSVKKGEYYFIDLLNYILNNNEVFPKSIVDISKVTLQKNSFNSKLENITNPFEYKIYLKNLPEKFTVSNFKKELTFFELKLNYTDGLAHTKIFVLSAFIEKYGFSELCKKKGFINIIEKMPLSFINSYTAIKMFEKNDPNFTTNVFKKENNSFLLLEKLCKDFNIDNSLDLSVFSDDYALNIQVAKRTLRNLLSFSGVIVDN
jgi:hypothetical protein